MPTGSVTPKLANLKRIGRYRIIRPLSKGGMAVVYEARRESLAGVSPKVAIKLILPEHAQSRTFRDLFINEARLGASMQHQNLVQIQAFEEEGDQYFLVMEYVEGLTLRRIISLCSRHDVLVPSAVIAEIGRQACEGLHYAHQAKDDQERPLRLVHRDIKPSNLILSPHGVVKVLDFGISKGSLRAEKKGSVKGTWGYMAPEQAVGREVGPRADVFGLAVVLYELAARKPMFRGKKQDEIKRLLQDDHAARMCATLDSRYRDLIAVLVRALQRDPGARYVSAEAFGRALSALLLDPISVRDEAVGFFGGVQALSDGKKPPASKPPVQPNSQDSMSVGMLDESGSFSLWIGAGVFSSIVAVTLLVGVAVLALSQVQGPRRGPALSETVHIPQAEPAGPAAAGVQAEVPLPEPTTPPAPVVLPEPEPEPELEPARVKVVRPRPAPLPAPRASRPPVPDLDEEPSEAASDEPGVLMIGSIQHGSEVYLNGRFVRQVPLRTEIEAGSHVVSIVSPDGRRKSFRVEVVEGDTVRRVWDFDRGDWR